MESTNPQTAQKKSRAGIGRYARIALKNRRRNPVGRFYMTDFERVVDKLRIDLAKTPTERSYAEGFISGKRHARTEIAVVFGFLMVVIVIVLAAR